MMKAKVIESIQETHKTKIIKIKPESSIDFKPGQFIMVDYETEKEGSKKKVKRPYSIASSPLNKGYIELALDKKPNGLVSTYLHNLKTGDIIEISEPSGFFVFDESIKEDIILIAAGTGIVPLIGISRYITEKKLPNNITLIYSCKTKDDIVYHNEIKMIKSKNKGFSFHITLTQEKNSNFLSGRINADMLNEIISDFRNKIFYICGPPLMVLDASKVLQDLEVQKEKIRTECYD